jgi:D-alanine--poly(phosphoribitol) ligase subunit 1
MLCARLRTSLALYGSRTVVEEAAGQWRLDGNQILAAAAGVEEALRPYAHRRLIVYLHKEPVYYAFLASAFLNRLDFCPLDTENPIQRVLDVAEQLGDAVILCDSAETVDRFHERGIDCIRIVLPLVLSSAGPAAAPRDAQGHYYIATSGTTGLPKLVQVPHDRTMAFLDWAIPFYEVEPTTRWSQFSSIGFDLSLVDFLITLCGGGTLIALTSQMDRIRPARVLARASITHWHSVPSMIPYFLREPKPDAPSGVRVFTFCGEPFLRTDADGLAERYPAARIVNTYGPTEATLFCSCFEYHGAAALALAEASLPIGQPIPGWNFLLLPDQDGSRLVILSHHLSEGYVGHGSEQFATMRLFESEMPAFDTGDYIRTAGTQLHFSHRKDLMVKVNGHRIDLGEIEAAGKHVGLVNPVAAVIGNRLVLAAEGNHGHEDDVRSKLGQFLPRASLPAEIRWVPAHPRALSGKLDRAAIRNAFGPLRGP